MANRYNNACGKLPQLKLFKFINPTTKQRFITVSHSEADARQRTPSNAPFYLYYKGELSKDRFIAMFNLSRA